MKQKPVPLWHESIQGAAAITKGLLLVHFANVLVNTMGYGPAEPLTTDPQSIESARLLKLTPDAIAEIHNELCELMLVRGFSA
ncbi:MAG: hypothetical protein OEM00_00210 [Burkholderiaceae bacterium]|nr:hypothetical protein [Burkholderiaceae bacterium]